jgi:outer membrane protein OmpA-like peptidoglycan-associated protein
MRALLLRTALLMILALSSTLAVAQQGPVSLGAYCGDSHRSPTRQIDKAVKALNAKDYPNAGVYIGAALRVNEGDQHALYLRGELGMRTKRFELAEASWKRLVQRCPGYKPDLLYFVGSLALAAGRPEEAQRYLEQWLLRDDREYAYDSEVEDMLEEIGLKATFLANPVPFDPKPARAINTRFDEYLAAMTPDGSQIYFTRRSKKRNKYDGPAAPTRSVEEFSMALNLGQQNDMPLFEEGAALTAPFNKQYNEGGPTITADNKLMVFTICERNPKTGKQNCDLYYTTFDYGVWNGIRPIEAVNQPESWESQPSISPNGDVLYFTSDRSGGLGGLDLYRCERGSDGIWSAPLNLGATINTSKNEKSPFIHPDSESLYFASDGHPGMGGYDLFKSKGAQEEWGKPQNLGYPINTERDEIGLMVTLDGRQAYFASNKINRANGWDIYFFDLYEAVRPDEVVLVKGTLTKDMFTADEPAQVILKNSTTGKETALAVSEQDGSFTAVVKKEEASELVLKVEAKKAAFSAAPLRLKLASSGPPADVARIEVDLEHKELAQGGAYPIPHILFETASDRLDAESKVLIQEFAEYLAGARQLKVQIQGHTDNVGDPAANLDLSKRRAKRVADLLYELGISSSRLSHRGYGQTKPVATNATVEGRAQNRRTVFVVTQL